MKILNAVLVISFMLVSNAALAERGSGEDNRIAHPESSSTQKDSEDRNFSPSDLTDRNP